MISPKPFLPAARQLQSSWFDLENDRTIFYGLIMYCCEQLNGGMLGIAPEKASGAPILEAFYPGFWGADAIAATVFGENDNLGGKIPFTTYAKVCFLPFTHFRVIGLLLRWVD
jgi:hypothetical protein